MPVVIGGEKAHLNRQSGELGIAYHWINGEPAMCLYPLKKRIATAGSYIIDVICDGLPDLVAMPPEPADVVEQAVKENVGELSMVLDGRTVAETVITDLDAAELAGANIQ